MKTVFLRAMEADDKSAALLTIIRSQAKTKDKRRFDVDPASFASVPRSPFSYWVSEQMRGAFKELPAFQSEGRFASFGLSTKNDFRYLRLWHEVQEAETARSRPETEAKSWVRLVKGGPFATYYADAYLLLNWLRDGHELKVDISEYRGSRGWGYLWSAALNGHDYYFRAGITWSRRTQTALSLRAMPAGCIFADKGPAAFVAGDGGTELLSLLAISNSAAYGAVTALQLAAADAAARSYEVGIIQRTPVPRLSATDNAEFTTFARRAWSLTRALDSRNETSHAFIMPALLQSKNRSLGDRGAEWTKQAGNTETEIASIQSKIDARCFDLYGIDDADRRAISDGFGRGAEELPSDLAEADSENDSDESNEADEVIADAATLTAELVSWAVGVAFGRFDVRLATGARALPPEPEPFDALPVCSPAMLTGEDGLPLSAAPAGYPLKFPENGILVDDPGHPLDLTAAVRAVFDVVFGKDAHARWNEAAAILDPKEQNLRNWLSKGFFEQHLKRHSKSRRKAPIVWQLATASSSYAVWLYAHRVNKDTFFQVQNDLVAQKLFHEEGVQTKLEKDEATSPSPGQRKALAAQSSLLEELRTLLDEVKRIAALWQPNLDDGVVLTMAPLFRLVPQHKAWQKELKAGWDGLLAGKFDWAHLAMHLWPERVVPKCATDRSLAIAHGLEDVFWVEAPLGKWKARPAPTRSVDDLVRDRTSSAVKASLKSLVEAPIVGGGGAKRGRKSAAQ